MRALTVLLLAACGASSEQSQARRAASEGVVAETASQERQADEADEASEAGEEREEREEFEEDPEERDTVGRLQPTTEHSAVNAVLFGTRLVIHEVGEEGAPLRLTARDLFDDRVAWSIERPREGFHGQVQRFDDEHILLNTGDRLDRIAVADGSVASSHPYRGRGRFLWSDRGVCLLNGDCSFDLLDCETAKPLRTFQIGRSHRRPLHRHGMSRGSSCFGGPTIIGRSGDTSILHVDNWETDRLPRGRRMRSGASGWVGVSQSGDLRWVEPHPETREKGVAGRFAWFADNTGVTVVRASSGRVQRRIARSDIRFVFELERTPPAVQLLFQDSVEVIDLQSGRVVERRAIPTGTLAVHADTVYPSFLYGRTRSEDEAQSFMWIPREGDPVVTTIPPGQSLIRGAPGERWGIGERPTYDSAGHPIPRARFEVERYRSGDAGPPDRARLKDGDRVIVELEHDAWSLGEAQRAGSRAIALFVKGEDWRTDSRVYIHRQAD